MNLQAKVIHLSCVSLLSLSVVSCVVCVDTSDESRLKNKSFMRTLVGWLVGWLVSLVGWPIELLLLHSPSAAAAVAVATAATATAVAPPPPPPPPLSAECRRGGRCCWASWMENSAPAACLGTIDGAKFCSEEEQFVEKKKEKAAANRKRRIV
ncbi:hypothetical protein T07_4624 [Trichinella nelsoni]|uniref:Secreted protein n=1 Tax=Trichinella nelsoni TaxID=6336 RepID=A0A0V0SHY5_9BILA|nr:hypothetical protein T07_4624 [Trichinella nelsoni]